MTAFSAFTWLVHSAVASTVLLTLAAVALSLVRQPADRRRLIQWSLVATLGALGLVSVPQFSALSLGLFESGEATPAVARPQVPIESPPEAAPSPMALGDLPPSRTELVIGQDLRHFEPLSLETRPADLIVQALAGRNELAALVIRGICIAYVCGMAIFFFRWVVACIGLLRLLRGACTVPSDVRAQLTRIAGPESQRIRLYASTAIKGPITWGTRRPVIVIPTSAVRNRDGVQLRYFLAHEWAHVVRRDFAIWQFATVLQIFLYYQPLFWWLRSRLAICMDQLADADASEQGGSTADYADFLVQLARLRLAPNPQLTLGISDRKSSLYQRIVFLVNSASRPRATCPRGRSLLISVTALLLAALVSVVRLDAEPAAETAIAEKGKPAAAAPINQPPAVSSPSSTAAADGSITYKGVVTDAVSGKPIEGVKVGVLHKNSRDWSTIETTHHETDADGRYSFVIPPEQAAIDTLYIEVEANHPNYSPKSRSGYSHAMIRKNLKLGEEPFYSHIRLWPGEPITGTIVSTDGEPLADVEVSMYSVSALVKERFRGAWGKTKTDAKGAFRIVPATPGDGVLWIKPEQYSPQAHRMADRRGDWGRIKLEKGTDVTGRILDVQGRPVVGVKVEARRKGDGEKPDEFLNQNAVANQIGREFVTGPAGEFALASLPAGDYTVTIESNSESYDRPPLQQVFLRKQFSISDGASLEPLEIRAVPHIVIYGQYLNSAGKPRRGSEVSLFGKVDGDFFYVRSNQPGDDGKFEIKAPHGITEARIDLITNEHSSLRWRLKPQEPLSRGRDIKLGTLEDDITGFEVVRYVAPIVLVKAVDESGTTLKDFKPSLKYTRPQAQSEQLTVYTTGNHVSFEEQQDGRQRSEQLLPDEPIAVTVERPGYTTTAQELSLPEGEERALTFVLKKVTEEKKSDEKKADVKKADEK